MNSVLDIGYKKKIKLEAHHEQLIGVSRAAQLLQQAFNRFQAKITVGLIPENFKEEFCVWLTKQGARVGSSNVSFCRNGFLHPPKVDREPLRPGELFTLDAWLNLEGWYADMARPYGVGPLAPALQNLYRAVLACNQTAQKYAKMGNSIYTIASNVLQTAKRYNCFVLDYACGHGIGRHLHQEPEVAFTYRGNSLLTPLKAGTIITLEPALTLKPSSIVSKGNLVGTNDGQLAIFAETMVAIKPEKSLVLAQ